MDKRNKRVVISGAYGMGNLGDEAISEVIVEDLLSHDLELRVTVLVFDKKLFLRSHPNLVSHERVKVREAFYYKNPVGLAGSWWDIARCSVFIWGGGGLIRNRIDWIRFYTKPLRVAQFFNKKIAVLSIGVDSITDHGVIEEIRKIEPPAFISVRDQVSKKYLIAAHQDLDPESIQVIPDPVFHLENVHEYHPESARLGLNLTFPDSLSFHGDNSDGARFIKRLADILNEFSVENELRITCIQTVPSKDVAAIESFKTYLDKKISLESVNPTTTDEFLKVVSTCDGFIGMRMHSLIMASRVKNLPILGIAYAQKVKSVFDEINFKNIVIIGSDDERSKIIGFLSQREQYAFDFKEALSRSFLVRSSISGLMG